MLKDINGILMGVLVPAALMLIGLYFWIRLRFLPLRRLRCFLGDMAKNGSDSFRALALSLGGTLGVGNIVGVSSAIYSGGFGAMLWMWISAFVAAILKYAEIILAMRHRISTPDGYAGGAPYYINDCLKKLFPPLSRPLSVAFALLSVLNCLFMGGLLQTNAISGGLCSAFGLSPIICGALLATAILLLFKGGARSIGNVTAVLVPLMSLGYVVISLAVILPRAPMLPHIFKRIFREAFTLQSGASGILGFLLSRALRFGVARGLFSNEAGCGTSPTAHAAACCAPVRQGFMGILEVLIDTVVLCSLTGFSVMLMYSNAEPFGESPINMTLTAYSSAFGEKAGGIVKYSMVLMVALFGFATLCCLVHYGIECVGFISKKQSARRLFGAMYVLCIFYGALVRPDAAWEISDLVIGIMTLINLCILFACRKEICKESLDYFKKDVIKRRN